MEKSTGRDAGVSQRNPDVPSSVRLMSSSAGALLTSLAITPMDVVKVRIQAQTPHLSIDSGATPSNCSICRGFVVNSGHMDLGFPKAHYRHIFHQGECNNRPLLRGLFHGLVTIPRTEGIGGLYVGLAPTLVMAVPATVVYYVLYDELRPNVPDAIPSSLQPMAVGMFARTVSSTLFSPLELARTRAMGPLAKERGGVHAGTLVAGLRQTLREGGVAGLYRGLSPTLARDIPFSAFYWVGIETLMPLVDSHISATTKKSHPLWSKFVTAFSAGAASGAVCSVLTHPFDVIKTRRQLITWGESSTVPPPPTGTTMSVLRDIVRVEGTVGLFAGLTARLGRIIPACAIMVSTYELGKFTWYHMEHR